MANEKFLKNIITIGESPQVYYHPKKGYLSMIFKYLDNPNDAIAEIDEMKDIYDKSFKQTAELYM